VAKESSWEIIPSNLEECLMRLDFLLDDKFKEDYKSFKEEEAVERVNFFGLGTRVRQNWNLFKGSRLTSYFSKIGVSRPEDMTHIIFTSYHRHLNQKDLNLNQQLATYNDFIKHPEKYNLLVDRFVVGDTVISHFYEFDTPKDIITIQGRCDLTAVIKEINRETNQIKIVLTKVTTTLPDMKYDKEKFKVGLESWEDDFDWIKKGEIVQKFIGR
jgi:hypothetical protein